MSRPSQNLDKVLIEVAKQMMSEGGITDLSIRQVCAKAKVNPGMFKYYFTNRANFLRIVHEELYNEFFAFLQEATARESEPCAKLRACLIAFTQACREKRPLFSAFIRDHINGKLDEIIPRAEVEPKELLLILELIGHCKAQGQLPQHISDGQIASLLLTSAVIPILAQHELSTIAPEQLGKHFTEDLSSEAASIERIDIVLKGLRT